MMRKLQKILPAARQFFAAIEGWTRHLRVSSRDSGRNILIPREGYPTVILAVYSWQMEDANLLRESGGPPRAV